jgi:hypothetical protein
VIKFLVLKSLGAKVIYRELTTVLTSTAYSMSQVKKWVVRFKQSEKTCEDQSRIDRHLYFLRQPLRDFLQEFPFAMATMIAQHFDESRYTIKQILQQELGL